MKRHQLSANFYLDEFTRSETAARHGIDNAISHNSSESRNLVLLCLEVLQPLRDALGPVTILSGYLCPALNKKIGGSKNSSHCDGLAAHIVVSGHTPLEVAGWLENHVPFDQVIHEFGQWTHASIALPWKSPRRERMTAINISRKFRKPRTAYVSGLYTISRAYKVAGIRPPS